MAANRPRMMVYASSNLLM